LTARRARGNTRRVSHDPPAPPPEGTVERWAFDYVLSVDLAHKLAPPPPPDAWEAPPVARRLTAPGRPPELRVVRRAPKAPGPDAIRAPARRAELVHTFLHHELQAAELFAWAILAYADAPPAFRRGLVGIFRDEIRHMALYAEHLARLGARFGDHPVRDWFWSRVPSAATPAHFCAVVGMGVEGGNLDHAKRFAERLRAVGDEEGARIEETIGEEEIPHVRFGLRWFRELTGTDDFATWRAHLPAPLSPMLMRGTPIERAERRRAGFSDAFLDELERFAPEPRGAGS
jgi:uncharacterized ferritin-like protein (DUF455 family)